MANSSLTTKEDSESTLENIGVFLLGLSVSIIYLPVTIMTIIIILILENIKIIISKRLILFITTVVFAIYACSFPKSIAVLFTQAYRNVSNITNDYSVLNVLRCIFINSFIYPLGSYVCMILLAIIVGIVIFEVHSYRKKLDKAGVRTFSTSIDNIAEEKASSKKIYSWLSSKKDIDLANVTLIGKDLNNKDVYINDNARHLLTAGTTGAGKTVALSNFINSACIKGYPALIIDGKGDTNKGSLLEISRLLAEKHSRKLYIIDITDPENSDKYNPFLCSTPTAIKDMLISMTDWTEPHYKINTERFIQAVLLLMEKLEKLMTFTTIIKNIKIHSFEVLSATAYKEGKITKDEHLHNMDIVRECGEIAENASARFSTIAESQIGQIFSNTQDGIDIFTALSQNAIILFILDIMTYRQITPMFGRLILIDTTQAVHRLYKSKSEIRKFFIFDEISTYLSEILIDLVNKSRSANVTTILATQSLADIEVAQSEAFREQIIENCNNYIILRQNGSKSAEIWAETIGTNPAMKITHQIDDSDSLNTTSSGKGSARQTREFIYHPDDIKNLRTGEAIFVSKDEGKHCKIKVNKPL